MQRVIQLFHARNAMSRKIRVTLVSTTLRSWRCTRSAKQWKLLILIKTEMAQRLHAIQAKILAVIPRLIMCQLQLQLLNMNQGPKRSLQFPLLFQPLQRQLCIISLCMQFQAPVVFSIRPSLELLFLKKYLAHQICTPQWEEMVNPKPSLNTSNNLLQHLSNHPHSHRFLQPCPHSLKYRGHHIVMPLCPSIRVL